MGVTCFVATETAQVTKCPLQAKKNLFQEIIMSDSDSAGVKRYIQRGQEYMAKRKEYRQKVRKLRFDTIAVHGMYSVEEAFAQGQGGIIEPLFPSTSQGYRDSDEMEAGLSYQIPTWCYSRIHNPTIFYLEETLSLLEAYGCPFDASALCTASGMAAIKQAIEPLLAMAPAPDDRINFVSSAQVYGGTFQLFNVRMKERGAQVRWVAQPWEIKEWEKQVDAQTRFLYTEMPSNPAAGLFRPAGPGRAGPSLPHPADRRQHHRHSGLDAAAAARRRHRGAVPDQDHRQRRRRDRRGRDRPP